ncbi:MAG: hypothetical protein PVS3B2_00430 [Candidatus Dormibacteraceae bacterium]
MPTWLIGKALAPFVALLLVALVTRPASRLVARRMRESWLKRLLLINSERDKVAYAVGCAVMIGMVLAMCVWASVWTGH